MAGTTPASNAALWAEIQGEIADNPTRASLLQAMGFGQSIQNFGNPAGTDAAFAPQYGVLG